MRHILKTSRIVITIWLIVVLSHTTLSVVAEEKATLASGASGASLTSTTVSGYVDSTSHLQIQPNPETIFFFLRSG